MNMREDVDHGAVACRHGAVAIDNRHGPEILQEKQAVFFIGCENLRRRQTERPQRGAHGHERAGAGGT